MKPTIPTASGFTLIEVLVALALMSLLFTVLIEALRVGGHTWRYVTREAASVDEVTRAQEFLRQRLGTIRPARSGGGSSSPSGFFVGESDRLEFSSTAATFPNDGPVRYQLGSSTSEPGNIEIRYHPDRTAVTDLEASRWSSEPLVVHATGLAIQFWERSTGTSGHWIDHWVDQTR